MKIASRANTAVYFAQNKHIKDRVYAHPSER
jgi:hypothetical protein